MTTLTDRVRHHAQNSPGRDAIASTDICLSYAELATTVAAQADALAGAGITSESVVGIECDRDIEHLLLCLAVADLGAESCTLPSFESAERRNSIAQRCGVTTVIGIDKAIDLRNLSKPGATVSQVSQASAPRGTPPADTPAVLLFSTSGTTGEPKVVILGDSDIVDQAPRHVGSATERFACRASIEHNFAKRHRLYCVAQGATNVFLRAAGDALVDECLSLQANVLHVSAFQAQSLLGLPGIGRLSQLRIKLGGSHVSTDLRQQIRQQISSNLQCGYGTTETGAIAFTSPGDTDSAETVGQPLEGIEVRIVDPDRTPLAIGERGEIAIRCSGLFRGYKNAGDQFKKYVEDGWYYTGDIGHLDAQNRITLSGRADDMFVFNSMNIYPQDIESSILEFPAVADVAVVPKPSPVHGNIPVALLVWATATDDAGSTTKTHANRNDRENTEAQSVPDLGALKKFARSRIGIRSPRQFCVVDQIPRNASGKILRAEAAALID